MSYMRNIIYFLISIILIHSSVVRAQQESGSSKSHNRRPSSTPRQSIVSDIRQVDFLNFTYHSSLCSPKIGHGIGETVRVRKGEFKNKDVYFGVVDNKIIYGDVTGDGREDAIVNVGCGENIANFGL